MNIGDIIRLGFVGIGLLLLCVTISSLAHRKMTENFCLAWGVVSVMFILLGITIRPYQVLNYVSNKTVGIFGIVGGCILIACYLVSVKISELIRKNHELAIHIALLNQENQEILGRLEKLEWETEEKKGNDKNL